MDLDDRLFRARHSPGLHQNVGDADRAASIVGGCGLILAGARHRTPGRLILAGLGAALASRGLRGRCPAYRALGLSSIQRRGLAASPEEFFDRGVLAEAAVTIRAAPEHLYEFWRSLENLPRFMPNLEQVRVIDRTRSRWTTFGSGWRRMEWDAEIINDEPPHTIAWRSLDNADLEHAGSVRFVPSRAGRGTQVKVRMEYLPPGGRVGDAYLRLIGEDPRSQLKESLRRLKAIIETGEVPTTAGQPAGPPRRAARPGAPRRSCAGAAPERAGATDFVLEASKESFPASDPPGGRSLQA